MIGESLWSSCWPAFGLLATEALLLVSFAALIARRISSAVWKRTVWQGCILALLGVLALEISGSARHIAAFVLPGRDAPLRFRPSGSSALPERDAPPRFRPSSSSALPGRDALPRVLADQQVGPTATETPSSTQGALTKSPPPGAASQNAGPRVASPQAADSTVAGEKLAAWLVLSWFCGVFVFIAINVFARLTFAMQRKHSRTITDPSLRKRVDELASRMSLRRPIHLFESARLIGPVAAGVLRPAIGLPPRFVCDHSPQQQDVMLAHELAHLAAKDPLWSRLADVLVSLLWWHPLAWWARRQLRAASESAADESSLLVGDGPRVLAEYLVALGGRLTRRQPAGWMGVEGSGFRSALGRRVERLLHLPAREWAPPNRVRCALARTLAPAALVAAVILCTAWTVPEPSTHGDRMKHPVWNRSLPLYALLATLYTPEPPAFAAEAPRKVYPAPVAVDPPRTPKAANHPFPGQDDGIPRLKAKLDSIVLDHVTYDSLPLFAVVESLMKEAAAKDPEKLGVNFLLGQPTEPIIWGAPAIDPATGLPVAGPNREVPDLNSVTIRIVPPIKKVRLIDALDAIKRVADTPITYTVEGYAVVLAFDAVRINSGFGVPPAQRTPPPLVVQAQTRSFKLDTNTFFASVKKLLRRQIDPASERVGEELRKDVFPRFGVKWNAAENIVFYNHLTGVLLVRASQEDLDTILAAIETLGGAVAENAFDPSIARGGEGGGGGRGGGSPAVPPKQ